MVCVADVLEWYTLKPDIGDDNQADSRICILMKHPQVQFFFKKLNRCESSSSDDDSEDEDDDSSQDEEEDDEEENDSCSVQSDES